MTVGAEDILPKAIANHDADSDIFNPLAGFDLHRDDGRFTGGDNPAQRPLATHRNREDLHLPRAIIGTAATGFVGLIIQRRDNLVIVIDRVFGTALRHHSAVIQHQHFVAQHFYCVEIVRDKNNRTATVPELAYFPHAFLLEMGVANRQRLIDNKTFGLGMDSDRKCQPHGHARGIGAQRLVNKIGQFRKFDHHFALACDFIVIHTQQQAVDRDVLATAQGRIKAGAKLKQTGHLATGDYVTAVRHQYPRENLEQGTFTGTVFTNHTTGFTRLNHQRHIVKCLEKVMARPSKEEFPQTIGRLFIKLEYLADMFDFYHGIDAYKKSRSSFSTLPHSATDRPSTTRLTPKTTARP